MQAIGVVSLSCSPSMRKTPSHGNLAVLESSQSSSPSSVCLTMGSRLKRATHCPLAKSSSVNNLSATHNQHPSLVPSRLQTASEQPPVDYHQTAAAAVGSSANISAHALHQQQHSSFASLSRVFLVGQQPAQNFMRNLATRKVRVSGPVSLLLFLFGLVAAVLAAVRTVLVRRVRDCQSCRGFGLIRCRLCDGEGSVEWSGKSNHEEMCPLCMTKRFVTCPDCGGFHHRRMFIHVPSQGAKTGVPDFLAT